MQIFDFNPIKEFTMNNHKKFIAFIEKSINNIKGLFIL